MGPERHDHQIELPADLTSARAARRFVADALVSRGIDHRGALERIVLLASELVTNAAVHAATSIRLVVCVEPSSCRLEIHDASPVLPVLLDVSEAATSGRGVALVEALADAWGAERTGDGTKVVWFTVGWSPEARSR